MAFGAIGVAADAAGGGLLRGFGASPVAASWGSGGRAALRAGQAGAGDFPGLFRDVARARHQQSAVHAGSGGPGRRADDPGGGGGGSRHRGGAGGGGRGGLFRGGPGVALLRDRGGGGAGGRGDLHLRGAVPAGPRGAILRSRIQDHRQVRPPAAKSGAAWNSRWPRAIPTTSWSSRRSRWAPAARRVSGSTNGQTETAVSAGSAYRFHLRGGGRGTGAGRFGGVAARLWRDLLAGPARRRSGCATISDATWRWA